MIWLLEEHRNSAQDLGLQLNSWQIHPKVKHHGFPWSMCSHWCKSGGGCCQGPFQACSVKPQFKYGSVWGRKTAQTRLWPMSSAWKLSRKLTSLVRCIQSALTTFCIPFFMECEEELWRRIPKLTHFGIGPGKSVELQKRNALQIFSYSTFSAHAGDQKSHPLTQVSF